MRWWILGLGAVGVGLAVVAKKSDIMLPGTKQSIIDWSEADVEALARMIASENPTTGRLTKVQNELVQTAICWTAVNAAKRRGISVADLVMPGGIPSAQNTGGRWASTRNPATDEYRTIARRVLSGDFADPTNGALQFDSPRAQRAALARGVSGYTKGPEEVAASRRKEGKVEVHLPSIDPDYMRWWRLA